MGLVLATIAIVDDDESIRSALRQLLRSAEFDARTFASAEDFLTSPELEQMDMLIADINLPGMNGVALLRALAASGRGIPAVLITARDDAGTLELIRRAGPVPHLRKPFSDDELFDAIAELLSR
jgi:FixJ family two-component response regulator